MCVPKTQSLEAVMSEDTRLQNFQRIFIPCLGLNQDRNAASYLTQLDPRLCIQNGCSSLSLSPDCPLVTLCPWAGGGGRHWSLMKARASKSSLLGIHTSELWSSVPPVASERSPQTLRDTALWGSEDMVSCSAASNPCFPIPPGESPRHPPQSPCICMPIPQD